MPFSTAAWNRIRYTIYSPFYDVVVRYAESGRRRSIEILNPLPGEKVLLIGCGTGLDVPNLPAGVEVTAIDYTPAMVELTRLRARELGIEINTKVMDAEVLDFSDGSFDCVILHLILSVVPDAEACARESARVLRIGGRASVFDKFLPDGATPSILRRIANVLIGVLATEINRQLGPLAYGAGFDVVHREPSILKGSFQVALLRKRG